MLHLKNLCEYRLYLAEARIGDISVISDGELAGFRSRTVNLCQACRQSEEPINMLDGVYH